MAENNLPAKKQKTEMQEYSLTSANSILSMANELAKFIKDRKLTQNIKGKEFVLVEAWTFAGMSMGLMPVPVTVTNLSTDSEIKYEAVVELLNIHTNQVVGRGFAICSNKEAGKKYFEEYAIASMAQTRATSKAYRLPLGFLMKAAGYEATPAEEMEFATAEVVEQQPSANVVLQVVPTYASPAIKESMLANIDGFKALYKEAEYAQIKASIDTLLEEKADDTKKKLQDGITKRILAKRPELNHGCTKAQLDLIDKMLLSHKFTPDEKAMFNTASFEYDNIDAANRIDWLTSEMKRRNTPAAA